MLLVTAFDLGHCIYQALKAGISGFLLKDEPPETLAAAVRTVTAGDALLAPGRGMSDCFRGNVPDTATGTGIMPGMAASVAVAGT
jgi:DNA-binding NarL/FixJ family response regulator